MLLLTFSALFGYGIASQTYTDSTPYNDNGPELRALWGGEHEDKWSAWLGRQPVHQSRDGVVLGARVGAIPGYSYAAVLRRFNMHVGEHTTFFAGTGVGYRDLVTCINGVWTYPGEPEWCLDGDPLVSNQWAFAQELGVRWRVVEFSIGHFSTGGITFFNKGVTLARFTLLGHVGKRKEK